MSEAIVTATGEIEPTTGSVRQVEAHRSVHSRFYLGMSSALLLIVLLGFAPTLYLRAFFAVPAIPVSVWVHGLVLTAWFVAFFLQTTLVAVRRTDIHRRLGWVLAGLGVAVLATSTAVTLNMVPRRVASGMDIEARIARFSGIVWADFAALLAFPIFLSTAIALRRRPEVHKRLMLLASVSLVQPALARIFLRWPVFAGLDDILWGLVSQLLFVLALGLYDLVSRNRVHPVTLLGGSFFMGTMLVSLYVIATSEAGRAFVRGLG
jgi:hypothetical protein